MISLQLVLAAAADCPDPSETVRMVLAMTRINLLERSPGVRVVKIAFDLPPRGPVGGSDRARQELLLCQGLS